MVLRERAGEEEQAGGSEGGGVEGGAARGGQGAGGMERVMAARRARGGLIRRRPDLVGGGGRGGNKGKPVSEKSRGVDFFVKRDGRWQVVNSQMTTIKE